MMKTILVLLFALTSSSALAQHHVPGGGPVGSPGNPGTGHPGGYNPGGGPQGPSHYPNYPNQNPYPPTTYPNPTYPVGPCVINSQYSGNTQYYVVYDGRGYYISAYYDYYQALRTAENYDRMGYCRGIRVNTGYPNPNPNPNPYPHTYCMVMTGQDAYGNRFYRVLDSAGRIIFTTQNYSQAVQVSQTDQRCFQYN